MRKRTSILAAIAAFSFLSAAPAEEAGTEPASAKKPEIAQSFALDLTQSAVLRRIRLDGMANTDNWMDLPAWWLPMKAVAEWRVDVASVLALSLTPELDWRETGGSLEGGTFAKRAGQEQAPAIGLDAAEARLRIPGIGVQAVFGKLRPQFGVNYIAPLSLMNLRGRDEYDKGLWMGGLSWTSGDFGLEAYCQTDPAAWKDADPVVLASANALFGVHEAGILFRREYGDNLGAWYRGQIGDEIIPYLECMLRRTGEYLDIAGLPSRAIEWNIDFLAGLGYSPEGLNLSGYLEYRFRQAGYRDADWEDLRGLSMPEQASAVAGLPYLQSATHSLGLHLRNADEIGGCLSWSLSCIYLAPDGLYADASASVLILDRLVLGLDAAYAGIPGGDPAAASSELGLWTDAAKFTLYATWKMNTKE